MSDALDLLKENDELRAENERLRGELMDANPSDLAQARDHASNLELAIEKTWRPEVKVLRTEVERLRQHDKEATDLTVDQQIEIGRLRAALEKIEAGYGQRLSAAELASIARQAL